MRIYVIHNANNFTNKIIRNTNKSNLKRINFSNANKYNWQYE